MSKNRRLAANTLAFFVLACPSSPAQTTSPGPPGPRDEARSAYYLTPVTACGLQVSGMVQLGATTVGEGYIRLQNVGRKDIASLRVSIDYETSSRRTISNPANLNFIRMDRQTETWLQAGNERTVSLFPENVARPGEQIVAVSVRVVGVVYGDGGICGSQGESVLSAYRLRLARQVETLRMALEACYKLGTERLESFIANQEIAHEPGSKGLAVALQRYLLDENGKLRPHPEQRIQQWIAELESFRGRGPVLQGQGGLPE